MKEFLNASHAELFEAMNSIDASVFAQAIRILADAYHNDKQVFVVGNGGSAATANHFTCDFGKNAVSFPGARRFRVISLSDNVEKITAWGNDVAFEEIFRQQLINLMNDGDVMLVISASGNSPDLVRACEYAKEKNAHLITMSGFTGGAIAQFAEAAFVIPLTSYERIEDIHSILIHNFVCYFKQHQELVQG